MRPLLVVALDERVEACLPQDVGRGLLNRRPAQEPLFRYYVTWILTNLPWSVFLYFALLGCIYAFTYYPEARESESQQTRLAAQLAEARSGALRMQLNPHFLFNSLNAIAVLVRDRTRALRRACSNCSVGCCVRCYRVKRGKK